jgi:hypothetical protein
MVWFPYAIPKQAFLLWLAVQNRLTTGDRLGAWGYTGDTQCMFCRNGMESRDHIFFMSNFSSRIRRTCMQLCNVTNPLLDWQQMMDEGCRQWKTKKMWGILCRVVLSSTVYNLWRARNEIKQHGLPRTEEQILRMIFWEVRYRISGKGKFVKTRENIDICQKWNIDSSILV